jgi:mono/diheme cytochrome c family protein
MRISTVALSLLVALSSSSITFAADATDIDQELKLSPVQLKFDPKDRLAVARGSYLVNAAGGCVGCHTMPTYEPGGDPFKGEPEKLNLKNLLAGGKCFGPNRSPNITPDTNGHPGGLALADFIDSIRSGKVHMMENGQKPDPNDIQKVMPWPEFRHLNDEDLSSIYAYLTAVPHAEPANLKCPPPKH